jgi:nucleoside-diphosphate-sugar epimerase
MATVLVAGAGYVGAALGVRLAGDGHVVYGLRRDPRGLPAELRPVAGDLGDRASLERVVPEGVELVAYTAAAIGPTAEDYAEAYVRGLGNLLAVLAARRAGVRRVLFTSSTRVHTQEGGQWVDETSAAEPIEATNRCLLDGERVLEAGPFPSVVLRLAGIYGPGRTRLVEEVLAGRARRPRGGPRWTNRIHRDDCVGAIAHLLALADPAPVYVGVDQEPAELGDVLTWIAARLGRPPPPVREEGEGESRARPERGNKRCSNARLLASGYRFAFPTYRDGYAALIQLSDQPQGPG